jgi:hypothetical protein
MALLIIISLCFPTKQVYAYSYDNTDVQESLETDKTEYTTTTDSTFDFTTVPIISEVNDLRTSDTKTFLKQDGSFVTVVYKSPVHYNVNGEWIDIDNTLNYDSKSSLYSTKANSFQVKFPNTLDENQKIQLNYDDYSVSWSLNGDLKSSTMFGQSNEKSSDPKILTKVNQLVSYSSILNNVDLQYIVNGNSVKENIVLNQYVEDFSLSFTYSLGNLTLELQTDGNYAFLDESGKAVFNFSYLYMYDAEGNDSSDVKMTVIQNDKNEYLVTVTPNSEWLKTAIFPVTIDPTIYSSYIALSFQDTYVSMQYPNTQSYYNYEYFYVSNTLSIIRLMNGLLSFSLPDMSGKKMTYSYLTLYKYNSETTQRTIEIHQNTSAFTENTVTWNTAPSYNTDVVDYKVVNGTSDTAYIFDITESVREWVDGVSPNYGFTIKDKNDVGALTRFYSSEHWLEAPVVEIGFIDSVGIKDYWTYNSQSAGEAGTGYISDYTGLMTWVRNDLSYESERGSFGLTMVYNVANRNLNIGYGLGWQTNYNMKVVFDTIVGKYYMLDATGYKNYFYLEGYIHSSESVDYPEALTSLIGDNEHGNCYESESGNGQILMVKYNSSNVITGIYVLSTDFTLLCFTYIVGNAYYLQYIKSQLSSDYPYVVTITRDTTNPDRITLIMDNVSSTPGYGNYISISYSLNRMSSAILYLLVNDTPIYTPLNKVTYSYTYLSYMSGYGMYSSSKYHDYNGDDILSFDQTIRYTYDSNARMTNAYENYSSSTNYGNRIYYTYNSTSDQVSSISNYFFTSIFSTLSYSYGLKMTTIIDDIGNYIIYKFDDYGHTINLLDSQGTSQSYVYLNIFKDMTDETGVIKHADGSPNFDNNHKLAYSSDPHSYACRPLAKS